MYGHLEQTESRVPMISATGNQMPRASGFTIVEIVLVIGLIALAASIMIVNLNSIIDQGDTVNAEESLVAAIRKARYLAASERQIVSIRFHEETGTLKLSNDETFALGPDFGEDARGDVRFYLVQPAEGLDELTQPEDATIQVDEIQFAPDRSSSPFVAELDKGLGRPERILFDPFSSLRRKASE